MSFYESGLKREVALKLDYTCPIFYNFLLDKPIDFSNLKNSDLTDLLNISKRNLLPGIIFNNCTFGRKQSQTKSQIKEMHKAFIIKYLSMKADLDEISKIFRKNNIDFMVLKGMAFYIKNLYPGFQRYFRDLDILVKPNDLKKAYSLLRSNGYRYQEEKTFDRCDQIHNSHQLPPMINSNKTLLELHFRITKPNYFSECPLAKYFFLNQEEINGIKVPDANGMINHAIYHGVQHHDRFIGPQVFLDIQQILAHENIKNNSNQIFPLEELRHSPIFNKMLSIISGVKLKGHFDEGFMGFIKELNMNQDWTENKNENIYLLGRNQKNLKPINLSSLKLKLLNISYKYQVKLFSLNFIALLIYEVLNDLKRVRFY